jgi:hypothetical protein
MKSTFELIRVWAAITGIVLAVFYFGCLWAGLKMTETVPMLVTAIGGFELVLYGQDIWLKRRARHG